MNKNSSKELDWRVHTASLLEQVLDNQGSAVLHRPLQILGNLLLQVAERAIALEDPILNELMCRLTLYSVADPWSPDFNPDALKLVKAAAEDYRNNVSKN